MTELTPQQEELCHQDRWDFTDLYTQGIIRVIPEPATWAIFAIGMMAFAFFRRRKK